MPLRLGRVGDFRLYNLISCVQNHYAHDLSPNSNGAYAFVNGTRDYDRMHLVVKISFSAPQLVLGCILLCGLVANMESFGAANPSSCLLNSLTFRPRRVQPGATRSDKHGNYGFYGHFDPHTW